MMMQLKAFSLGVAPPQMLTSSLALYIQSTPLEAMSANKAWNARWVSLYWWGFESRGRFEGFGCAQFYDTGAEELEIEVNPERCGASIEGVPRPIVIKLLQIKYTVRYTAVRYAVSSTSQAKLRIIVF